MVQKSSAWAGTGHTPAEAPPVSPLVVQRSERLLEGEWAKVLPSSPKGFAKLAKDHKWEVVVWAAEASNDEHTVSSWRVTALSETAGVVAVWEQHEGKDVVKTKLKPHVTVAYANTGDAGLFKTNVTTLKNLIKESK